jgi:flagellar protein FliT
MDTEMNALSLYETMSDLSGRMVEAAHTNDWDRLVALENDVAHLRDNLIINNRLPPALTPEERTRKVQLIRRILADDAEVRRHTEPWMCSARKLFGADSRDPSGGHAYGA